MSGRAGRTEPAGQRSSLATRSESARKEGKLLDNLRPPQWAGLSKRQDSLVD